MKYQTGIWLDLRDAWIINLLADPSEDTVVKHIHSDIEEFSAVGGTRSKAPWGPQIDNKERTLEERRHHEEQSFFKDILKNIDPETEELVIFGPSDAKIGLFNLLDKQYRGPKIAGVEAADKMTAPQRIAWVRNFFDRAAPRFNAG